MLTGNPPILFILQHACDESKNSSLMPNRAIFGFNITSGSISLSTRIGNI